LEPLSTTVCLREVQNKVRHLRLKEEEEVGVAGVTMMRTTMKILMMNTRRQVMQAYQK
jgi:hypothetical protein